jgi:ATP-dependent Lon protease
MIYSILHFSDLHQDVHNEIDNTSLVESLYRDVQMTPDYVKNKIKVHFVSTIDEVLNHAILETVG